MTITVGIDCGLTGAIAAIRNGHELVYMQDMPTVMISKTTKVKQQVSGVALSAFMRDIVELCPHEHISVCVEKTASMTGQGVASMFSMGHSLGVVDGVLGSHRLMTHHVAPAVWKKKMGLPNDKEIVRSRIHLLYPAAELHLKKHHNRAEAIALAIYLWREKFHEHV